MAVISMERRVALALPLDDAINYGFTLRLGEDMLPNHDRVTFSDLNAAWRDEIGKRRVASLMYAPLTASA